MTKADAGPPIPNKPFWKSKTFWGAALGGAIGAYKLIAPAYHLDDRWVSGAEYFCVALGIWGVRTADTKIGTPADPAPQQPDNVQPSPNATESQP